jgi:hypothetical protein
LAIDTATVDLVLRIQREITRDTAAGLVPIWVSSMWQLHDYVDATAYGGLADDSARVPTATVVRVHAEVDRWLAAHGHVPVFSVRTPDYEITRVHAASLPDAQRIVQRHPHVRVVLDVRGGTVTVEPTDFPGPGLRRARIRGGPHAGHLASFCAERDLAGITRWIHDGGAYFPGEVEEVCATWLPFAWYADRSPVVCQYPADHQHAEHAVLADDVISTLTWTSAI